MIKIGAYVKIISSGICGYIVDIRENSRTITVEEESRNSRGIFELYDCSFDEVEFL